MPDTPEAKNSAVNYYAHMDCLQVNSKELASVASSIALSDKPYKSKVMNVMLKCGMYEESGNWGRDVGLPAKSGVSGVVWAIIDGIGGVCAH